uniref:beta-mannosidase n=1 Tax=Heligmosomoides polygyrus TaxID=6339 RepID=A0A8L8KE38_HELPZ
LWMLNFLLFTISFHIILVILEGSVPGDIFTDLYRSTIIPDPLFADNHLHLKWVSAINWSYIYSFPIDQTILKVFFNFLDTVSSVFLNGVPVLNTSNQFVEYFVNIDGLLRDSNTVEVRFTSPVRYAKEKSAHGHRVPPTCPPKTYHGECHPNFIRKAQYSFSWDWGPAIPTVGLWKPVQIIAFDDYIFDDFTWTTERTQGEVRIFTEKKGTETSLRISIPELDVKETQRARVEGGDDAHLMHFKVRIPRDKVAVWWPNGEGEQKLYDITVEAASTDILEVTHKVGFRHVKLVQDFVDRRQRSKGRHFYVRVNDRPLFLKGSNWIPISMFLSRNNDERMKFLLDSAVETLCSLWYSWCTRSGTTCLNKASNVCMIFAHQTQLQRIYLVSKVEVQLECLFQSKKLFDNLSIAVTSNGRPKVF